MKTIGTPCWALGIILTISVTTSAAIAGTINTAPDPVMGCFAELNGPITAGDSDKLSTLIDEFKDSDAYSDEYRYGDGSFSQEKGRVCLNSPGGSLVEGIALAQLFHRKRVGTAVGRNKSCLSACAVAFMGGLVAYENDVVDQPDRILHPLGKLGFHSPDLGVPTGQYDEKVVKKAYNIALKSVSSLLDIAAAIAFPNSLSTTMLATPAEEMYIVSSVGEAARWRIAIAPIAEPAQLTIRGLVTTCGHVDNAELDTEWRSLPQSYGTTTIAQSDRGTWEGEMEDGFRQELATGCSVSFRPIIAGGRGRTLPSGWAIISGNYAHSWAYQTYGPKTPITQLALADDAFAKTSAASLETSEARFKGRCIVLKGTDVTDNDPCDLLRLERRGEDLKTRVIDTYVWPSGAKTVVENLENVSRLNGVDTQRDLEWKNVGVPQKRVVQSLAAAKGNNDPMVVCWPNPNSGNRFCFLDDVPSSQSAFFSGPDE
ncbi:hypothetical protein [Tateyamaria sp.]|uniref:COG3904 family protein n=1 Tax=Tateyamaria sp. TaxID=1929288 RepID=UPI00329B9CE4